MIDKLKKQENSVKEKTEVLEPVKVFVYDGGENKPFATVSYEDIIKRNPEVIIIFNYYTDDDAKKKIDFLKSKSELSGISAIKNNRFIVVSGFSVFPSLQNINAIETIAKGLHPDKF